MVASYDHAIPVNHKQIIWWKLSCSFHRNKTLLYSKLTKRKNLNGVTVEYVSLLLMLLHSSSWCCVSALWTCFMNSLCQFILNETIMRERDTWDTKKPAVFEFCWHSWIRPSRQCSWIPEFMNSFAHHNWQQRKGWGSSCSSCCELSSDWRQSSNSFLVIVL